MEIRVLFVILLFVWPLHSLVAIGSPEINRDLWCETKSSHNTQPVTPDNMEHELNNRIDSGASFVVFCLSAETDDPPWKLKTIAELIYVPVEAARDDDWFAGGFVRLFRERSKSGDARSWKFDRTFAVQWRPVAGDNPKSVLNAAKLNHLPSQADVKLSVRSVR